MWFGKPKEKKKYNVRQCKLIFRFRNFSTETRTYKGYVCAPENSMGFQEDAAEVAENALKKIYKQGFIIIGDEYRPAHNILSVERTFTDYHVDEDDKEVK